MTGRPRQRMHPDTPIMLALLAAVLLVVAFGSFLLVAFLQDAVRLVVTAAEYLRAVLA